MDPVDFPALLRNNFEDMTGFRAGSAADGPGILSPGFDERGAWERRVTMKEGGDNEQYICSMSHAGTFSEDESPARKEGVNIDGQPVTCWTIPTIVTVRFRDNTEANWKLTTFRSALEEGCELVHNRNGFKQRRATFTSSHKMRHRIEPRIKHAGGGSKG